MVKTAYLSAMATASKLITSSRHMATTSTVCSPLVLQPDMMIEFTCQISELQWPPDTHTQTQDTLADRDWYCRHLEGSSRWVSLQATIGCPSHHSCHLMGGLNWALFIQPDVDFTLQRNAQLSTSLSVSFFYSPIYSIVILLCPLPMSSCMRYVKDGTVVLNSVAENTRAPANQLRDNRVFHQIVPVSTF